MMVFPSSTNCMNMPMGKQNTSGTVGVAFDKIRNKWVAQIMYKGKHIYLGSYTNKYEAIKAILRAKNNQIP